MGNLIFVPSKLGFDKLITSRLCGSTMLMNFVCWKSSKISKANSDRRTQRTPRLVITLEFALFSTGGNVISVELIYLEAWYGPRASIYPLIMRVGSKRHNRSSWVKEVSFYFWSVRAHRWLHKHTNLVGKEQCLEECRNCFIPRHGNGLVVV